MSPRASSGTSLPASIKDCARLPLSEPAATSARRRSPADTWTRPKSFAIVSHWVPLPLAGAPAITTRRGRLGPAALPLFFSWPTAASAATLASTAAPTNTGAGRLHCVLLFRGGGGEELDVSGRPQELWNRRGRLSRSPGARSDKAHRTQGTPRQAARPRAPPSPPRARGAAGRGGNGERRRNRFCATSRGRATSSAGVWGEGALRNAASAPAVARHGGPVVVVTVPLRDSRERRARAGDPRGLRPRSSRPLLLRGGAQRRGLPQAPGRPDDRPRRRGEGAAAARAERGWAFHSQHIAR